MGLLSLGVMVASSGIPRLKYCELALGYKMTGGFEHRVPFKMLSQSLTAILFPHVLLKQHWGSGGGQSEKKAAQELTTFSFYFIYGIFGLNIY